MATSARFCKILRPRYLVPIGILIVVIIFTFIFVAIAGPYEGRLLDETTRQPIAGAVVVGYWTSKSFSGTTHCLDARETVTDDKGEFTIPISAYGELFGRIYFAIYKVGYTREGPEPWTSLKNDLILKTIVTWDGNRAVIPLKRVSKLRLMEEGSPPHISCGRSDGKPLTQYIRIRKEYHQARELDQ